MSPLEVVEIHTATGPRNVIGRRVEGGLALHDTLNDVGVTLTHVGSGKAIWRRLPDMAAGTLAMTRLLEVADWTADAAVITAKADELRREMGRIAADLDIEAPRPEKKKRRKRT